MPSPPLVIAPLAALVLAAGCGAPCADFVDGDVAGLAASALGPPNRAAIDRFLVERAASPGRTRWLAVVPGTSEQWGHHKAPPPDEEARGVRLSEEFAARLDRGYALLASGTVRFLLLSGGAVDPDVPTYVEAERGRDYLLAQYAARFPGGDLAEHLLVDPLAQHSTTNLRNADKLATSLGLGRLLVATTMPERALLGATDYATQGFYFLYHEASGFDDACRAAFGYLLGEFTPQDATDLSGAPMLVLDHCGLDVDRLRLDAYGP